MVIARGERGSKDRLNKNTRMRKKSSGIELSRLAIAQSLRE